MQTSATGYGRERWSIQPDFLAGEGDDDFGFREGGVDGANNPRGGFEYAHEADPEAILRYNDYGLENPEKRKKLIKLIKGLQEKKIPVMVIGTQAHLNVSITFDTMDQSLAEMKTLGLPIHVTELDVNGAAGGQRGFGADIGGNSAAPDGPLVAEADKKLTEAYTGIFRAFLKHRDAVKIVTFWGPNVEGWCGGVPPC